MGAGWVGGVSRSKALLSRCLGTEATRQLASASPDEAVRMLSTTAYRRFLAPEASLAEAQRAVSAMLLWHLRVLAGWLPRSGGTMLRALTAGFEIANTEDLLRSFNGAETPPPYRLGALATAWGRIRVVRSPGELREALAGSAWGDPGGEDPASLAVSLRIAAAARVASAARPAERWAAGRAALLMARVRFLTDRPVPGPAVRRAGPLLGSRALAATSLPDFSTELPPNARWALDAVADPEDLWRAEARWWASVDREGREMLRATGFGPEPVVGAVAVLSADAWRVRGALESATHGGVTLEAFDASS